MQIKSQNIPKSLLLFVGALLLVNIGQAYFTELLHDEAYYWYYAQTPAWGYFDHPPMVAWMIVLGNLVAKGELGVRLISCLMGSGTLILLWLLINRSEFKVFRYNIYIWLASIVLVHAYGFLSLPDTPLLFFTTVFLFIYREFLHKPNWGLAVALGVSMAALMYSKYHAALVIIAVLASNPSLFKNRYAWGALLISLLAYFPHLFWLYEHNFVSIQYHISERPNQMYRFDGFTLGYLLNLLALFGLTFPWVYWGLFRFKPKSQFERALVFIAYVIFIFFFVSSFQRRVQTQWLIAASIPIAVILGRQIIENERIRRWLYRAGIANLIVLAFLRLGLIYESLFPVPFETHGNKEWVKQVENLSENAPVVFENSYRLPSVYSFYSGQPAFTLVNAYYRHNQYSIDNSEADFQGKRVFYIPIGNRETPYGFLNQKGEKRYGYFIPDFYSTQKLTAGLLPDPQKSGTRQSEFWINNPYEFDIPLDSLQFGIAYLDRFKKVIQIKEVKPVKPESHSQKLKSGDSLFFQVRTPKKLPDNPSYLRAVVKRKRLLWGLNGASQKIQP